MTPQEVYESHNHETARSFPPERQCGCPDCRQVLGYAPAAAFVPAAAAPALVLNPAPAAAPAAVAGAPAYSIDALKAAGVAPDVLVRLMASTARPVSEVPVPAVPAP